MDDDFEKIDDNTYRRVEESIGTFTVKMAGGKFTSYEFTAASGSAYDALNGTYAAPKSSLPAGALKGEFSVSATKKIHFSKGNLYWDGDSFEFEANQYDFQNSSWSASHVSYFYWSKTASVAYASLYNESGMSGSDVFFTNAETETAKSDFTVNGVTGKYRTLSKDEWVYLINWHDDSNIRKDKCRNGVTVCGKENCLILAPDDFTGSIGKSYDATTWPKAEAAGLVCLPAAGGHRESGFVYDGIGYYWSSTTGDIGSGDCVAFMGELLFPDSSADRNLGCSVRLITDVK